MDENPKSDSNAPETSSVSEPNVSNNNPGSVVTPKSTKTPVAAGTTSSNPNSVENPAQPSVSGQYVPPSAQKSKVLGGKKKLILIIVAAILVVLGGAAFAVFGVIIPNKPEMVLKDAVTNTLSLESAKFNGELNVETDRSGFMPTNFNFSGAQSKSGDVEFKFDLNLLVTRVELELKGIGESLYLKVSGLDGLDSLLASTYGGDQQTMELYTTAINAVNEQWIEVDSSLLNMIGGESQSASELSEEAVSQIQDALLENMFIEVTEELDGEQINGEDAFHYKIGINNEKLIAFLEDLKDLEIAGMEITDDQIDDIAEGLEQDILEQLDLEMWITKSDRIIKRVQVSGPIDPEGSDKFVMTMNFTEVNTDFDIETPEDTKMLLELFDELGPLFGPGLGSGVLGITDILGQ